MNQAFQMISGPVINDLISRPDNRLKTLLSASFSDERMIQELYWSALSRPPQQTELQLAESRLANAPNKRAALEDLTWSLLNAKEFIFRY